MGLRVYTGRAYPVYTATGADRLGDQMTTMSDLIYSTHISADDETTLTGWYRRDQNWNGFLCVLMDDENAERFVSDYNDAMSETKQGSLLEIDGDEIVEITGYADGERLSIATRIFVDGVSMWDFTNSGITFGLLEDDTDECAACAYLTAHEIAEAGWGCGSCGLEFDHAEGVHTVQYGTFHEFVCNSCLAEERASA